MNNLDFLSCLNDENENMLWIVLTFDRDMIMGAINVSIKLKIKVFAWDERCVNKNWIEFAQLHNMRTL